MSAILQTELTEVRKITSLIQNLSLEYGTKSLEIEDIKSQLNELIAQQEQIYHTYKSAMKSNDDLIETLRSKYGDCKIDLETGQIS